MPRDTYFVSVEHTGEGRPLLLTSFCGQVFETPILYHDDQVKQGERGREREKEKREDVSIP